MSNNQSSYSASSFSYSSSSSTVNGQTSGQTASYQTYSDNNGTTVRSSTQTNGQAPVEETRRYNAQGRELLGSNGAESRRIQDVTDEEQAQRDREYEERIEEEYAKREGGA